MKKIFFLMAIVLTTFSAMAQVEPEAGQTYYIQADNGQFLSRGNAWGTQASLDAYGMPWTLVGTDLTSVQLQILGQTSVLGFDENLYTDAGGTNARSYVIDGNTTDGYTITSTTGYACYVNGTVVSGSTTETATKWKFLTKAQRDEYVNNALASAKTAAFTTAGLDENETYSTVDVTSKVTNPGMGSNTDGWTVTLNRQQSGQPASSNSCSELWQATGVLTQTVTGLVPNGLYKMEINAQYRCGGANNDAAYEMYNTNGYNHVNATVGLNGNNVPVCHWASYDGKPNTRSSFETAIKAGQYLNTVYGNADADGNLTITINKPGYAGSIDWFTFGQIKLYGYKVTDADVIALVATMPTDYMDATVKQTMNDAKTALDGDKSGANYNALSTAIENAKTSVAAYKVAHNIEENATGKARTVGLVTEVKDADNAFNVAYVNGTLNGNTEADAVEKAYNDALAAMLSKDYTDKTSLITNPSFEDGDFTGWTNSGSYSSQNNDSFEKDGTYYAEQWVSTPGNLTAGTLTQTLTNLPAGDYILTAKAQNILQGHEEFSYGFYIKFGSNYARVRYVAGTYAVALTTTEAGDVTIVAENVAGCTGNWICLDNFKLYKKFNLQDAKDCYATVTASDAKVDDKTHKDLYTALETAINADPLVAEDLATATENAYRQYYYDKLASDVIVYTNLNKNFVDGDADKATLQAALDAAAKVYSDNIDLTKTSTEYKNAYDALEASYTTVLGNQYDAAKTALKNQIDASTDAIATLANATVDNATTLKGDIATAQAAYDGAVNTVAGVKAVRTATSTLATQTSDLTTADLEQAKAYLNTAIATATADKSTISPVSTVVADELDGYIATAQAVYDNTATTAIQAKDAADQLTADQRTADANFTAFKDAKTALNDAIAKANTIVYTYTGVSNYLADAIATAQDVYGASLSATTQELKDAKTALESAESTAEATNTAANTLAGDITIAQDLVTKMDDATEIADANTAITAAQTALTEKANGATELGTADQTLKDAVKGYYESNLKATTTALKDKITEAENALNNTLAYTGDTETHYAALKDAIATAQGVLTGVSTPAEMTAAIDPLNTAITTNVAADLVEAQAGLTAAIDKAQTQFDQYNVTNTIYAAPLKTYIDESNELVANGTAKECKAKAEAYTSVYNSVKSNITKFMTQCGKLNSAIESAKTTLDATHDTHVGIIAYLTDAYNTAYDITNIENTPIKTTGMTTQEVKDATTAIKNANSAAKKANIAAENLETSISTAEGTVASIFNGSMDGTYTGSIKEKLETAIQTAKDALTPATNLESELQTAKATLDAAVTAYVNEDIDVARYALNDAITAATTAKGNLAYDANKTTLGDAITAATTVKDQDPSATAIEMVDAKNTLDKANSDVVAKDLQEATDALTAALATSNSLKDELTDLYNKLASYPDEQSKFNDPMIKDLATAIATAQGVQDATTSTGAAKADQVDALADAVTTANAALDLYYNTECQKLADVYTADKYIYNEVMEDVTALPELAQFADAFTTAEDVYVSIKAAEPTYDVSDVINARAGLEKAYTDLTTAKAAWDAAVKNLEDEIAVATATKAGLQACHQATTGATLQTAIDAAQAVDDAKKTTQTADITTAYETLKAAVEAAIEDDTKWSFADATPDYKEGTYAAGNVTYTRTGSAIAEGNYGTFCLPFEVATDNFKAVYLPLTVSVLSSDETKLTLFLNQVEDATIPANTPFFAELAAPAEAETLALVNASETVVPTTPAAVTETKILVYKEKENSSLTTLDKTQTFTWTGTMAKTTDVENSFVFKTNGSFTTAKNYISPFRAYLTRQYSAAPVKAIDIIVNFGTESENATAIRNIMGTAANDVIYTVGGTRVSKTSQKGVYIINGQKVVK